MNRRASANSIEVELLDPADAKELEPKIRTKFPSLFIKSTSVVDPMELVNSVSRDFIDSGGEIHFGIKYDKIEGGRILIAGGQRYHFGHLVNCAGLYSDKVASDFGFGNEYIMMPFKGVYLYLPPDFSGIKTHIYPVPDLKNPFLGVHLTRTLNGNVKIGPTAMPSFWREHYQGVDNFQLDEFKETISQLVAMFIQNKNGFRDLAIKESLHQSKKFLLEEAGRLVRNIPAVKSMKFGRPGIRAQLVQKSSHKLVMDFVIEGDRNSTHILNAVSPALTSAWPFAEYVVDKIESGLTDK